MQEYTIMQWVRRNAKIEAESKEDALRISQEQGANWFEHVDKEMVFGPDEHITPIEKTATKITNRKQLNVAISRMKKHTPMCQEALYNSLGRSMR